MIAKEIAARRTGGSFRGLVTYITSNRGKTERVGRVQITNCVSADVAGATLEVENTQGHNRRAKHTTYHLMLAFPAGEYPGSDVLEAIERRACAALGFGEHERVSVVHHDTDHVHVHVAINRVHPRTHNVHSPSYSKLVLDRLCVELEREYGLQTTRHRARERQPQLEAAEALRSAVRRDCAEELRNARSWAELHEVADRHGLRVRVRGSGLAVVDHSGVAVKASTVSRDLSKRALERRLGAFEPSTRGSKAAAMPAEPEQRLRRAPDMERVAGFESLIGYIQRGCSERLRLAQSWAELHDVAAQHGLRAQLRGNGLVFTTADGLAVKASSVSRELSKAALERRLGAFEAPAGTANGPRTKYEKRPIPRASALHERYREERAAALARRARVMQRLREQRGRDEERLNRISQRRWAAVRIVAKGRVAWMLWRAYARQADRRDRERARQRYRASVRAAALQHPRMGWLDWLRDQASRGDAAAVAVLRSRNGQNGQLEQRRLELLSGERADGRPEPRRNRERAGSTRKGIEPSAGPARNPRRYRIPEPYGGRPRSGTAPQSVADLRGVSALDVVRFGRAPQVLLPTDARPHVEQRRAEQPDPRVRRDPPQQRVDSASTHKNRHRRR